jgi:hypothetical protein
MAMSLTVETRKKVKGYTDKKEKKIFFIYKKIQNGAIAKSYMRKGFLINEEMRKYLVIYEENVIVIYDLQPLKFWISLYIMIFFFYRLLYKRKSLWYFQRTLPDGRDLGFRHSALHHISQQEGSSKLQNRFKRKISNYAVKSIVERNELMYFLLEFSFPI